MLELVVIIGFAFIGLSLRYVFYKIFDKGADALTDAYKRKKNSQKKDSTENLSDRYR